MEMLETLLAGVRSACAAFPDKRHGEVTYSMADIGLSAFSLFFIAERVVPRPPARAGGRAEDVELPKPVRHDRRADRQSYPRHARPRASLVPAARLRPNPGDAAPAWRAARLPTARRACVDRAGRHRILLLAKAWLPTVPDAPAW